MTTLDQTAMSSPTCNTNMTTNMTHPVPHMAVDTANANEAAELDAIALLADTWDVDLVSRP